jgi:hypothetical protein
VNCIWATRGRTWGFRLLWTGGLQNSLEVYEAAFAGTDGAAEVLSQRGELTAVRFLDPEGRTDRAGRVIPHEFVILTAGTSFKQIDTARTTLWAQVAPFYASVWEQPAAPRPDTLR